MQNTVKNYCGEKPKNSRNQFFRLSMVDEHETEVGEVEGRLQRGFEINSNEFY